MTWAHRNKASVTNNAYTLSLKGLFCLTNEHCVDRDNVGTYALYHVTRCIHFRLASCFRDVSTVYWSRGCKQCYRHAFSTCAPHSFDPINSSVLTYMHQLAACLQKNGARWQIVDAKRADTSPSLFAALDINIRRVTLKGLSSSKSRLPRKFAPVACIEYILSTLKLAPPLTRLCDDIMQHSPRLAWKRFPGVI